MSKFFRLVSPMPIVFGLSNKLCYNNIFSGLVVVFNLVSKSRIEEVGPNRACAEWLVRNGAAIKWKDCNSFCCHYQALPLDKKEKGSFYLKEVDATNAAISHIGFPHFKDCKHIEKIRFVKCDHLKDAALEQLELIRISLKELEIFQCCLVTDAGLNSLRNLWNLKKLSVGELERVKDLKGVVSKLQVSLPNCEIKILGPNDRPPENKIAPGNLHKQGEKDGEFFNPFF